MGEIHVLPKLTGRKPDKSRTVSFINYPSTGGAWEGFNGRKDRFAVRWTGSFKARQGGTYEFKLTSDDGSAMWLGDAKLIDNDGLHGMRDKVGSKSVGGGLTNLRIEMFENGGGAGCIFRFKGPDSDNNWKVVPRRSLNKVSDM